MATYRIGSTMPHKIDPSEINHRARLIGDEHAGIHRPNEIYYLGSIAWIAQACVEAFISFESMAVRNAQPERYAIVFDELQRALSLAANLSRYFWPSREGIEKISKARGDKLRKGFSLDDSSALRDRKLRDAIEHFDERLDTYLLDPHYGNTHFSTIGRPAFLAMFRFGMPISSTTTLVAACGENRRAPVR